MFMLTFCSWQFIQTLTCEFHPHYRAKHPVKVHVWAGISLKGRTGICIFDGIMDAAMYVNILEGTLIPFIREVFPEGYCRFMQDNDPKHTSHYAQDYFFILDPF